MKSSEGPRIQVAVVEDQTIFRDMLCEWLAAQPRFEVAFALGTASAGTELLARRAVDVLILDVGLPDETGLEMLHRLPEDNPRHVVLVTAHEEPYVLRQLLASRARGIVMKGAPLSDLGLAIERAAAGATFYCRRTSELIRASTRRTPLEALTEREREILALVVRGATSPQIAERLGIRVKTVQNHRANLMEKLGIHDVAGLTRFAIAEGLISPAELRGEGS